MADAVFLVYLARDGLLVVAEYAGELGFWESVSCLPFWADRENGRTYRVGRVFLTLMEVVSGTTFFVCPLFRKGGVQGGLWGLL